MQRNGRCSASAQTKRGSGGFWGSNRRKVEKKRGEERSRGVKKTGQARTGQDRTGKDAPFECADDEDEADNCRVDTKRTGRRHRRRRREANKCLEQRIIRKREWISSEWSANRRHKTRIFLLALALACFQREHVALLLYWCWSARNLRAEYNTIQHSCSRDQKTQFVLYGYDARCCARGDREQYIARVRYAFSYSNMRAVMYCIVRILIDNSASRAQERAHLFDQNTVWFARLYSTVLCWKYCSVNTAHTTWHEGEKRRERRTSEESLYRRNGVSNSLLYIYNILYSTHDNYAFSIVTSELTRRMQRHDHYSKDKYNYYHHHINIINQLRTNDKLGLKIVMSRLHGRWINLSFAFLVQQNHVLIMLNWTCLRTRD